MALKLIKDVHILITNDNGTLLQENNSLCV